MAKGKFEEWLTPEGLLRLEAWARDGLTDEQIATNMGIAIRTLYEYKERYPQIMQALKIGKEVADIQVENALYTKALGIHKTLQKPIKVKDVYYENGKRIRETEHIEYGFEEIYIPPDTTAQIFWLKNRKPKDWRDKRDVGVEGNIDVNNPYDGLTTEELRAIIKKCEADGEN